MRDRAHVPVVLLAASVAHSKLDGILRCPGGAAVISTSIRGTLFALAVGTLVLGLPAGAAAQSAPQSVSQNAPNNAGQAPSQPQNAQADDSSQVGQPMSLGDLARLVRAKKQTEPKAVKVIDDENLPRNGGGISVVGNGPGAGGGSSSAGKMTLLDFWASWCGPCRESVPDLKALQRTYGSDQLEVISVNEDKDEDAGRSFASEHGMNWEVQFDSSGATARQYNVSAFPTFILMDGNGREVQRFVGEDPSDPLAGRIGPYIEKAPKASM